MDIWGITTAHSKEMCYYKQRTPGDVIVMSGEGRTTMPKRVLIIEDDEKTADLYEQVMLSGGYSAYKTTQALRFLDAVRDYQPDIILLDFMMPYLDGYDELRLLGMLSKPIPVIIITAKADIFEHEEEYRALGVVKIIRKPPDIREMLESIFAFIGA